MTSVRRVQLSAELDLLPGSLSSLKKATSTAAGEGARPTQVEKRLMHARVVGEFRMECRSHYSSLPHGDGIAAFGGDHFNAVTHSLDFRGANEHHFDW